MTLGYQCTWNPIRNRVLRLLACLLLVAQLAGVSCSDEANRDLHRQFNYAIIGIVVVLVAIGIAVSEDGMQVEGLPDYNCSITNHADQPFSCYADGLLLGTVASGETAVYKLGPGPHELAWHPLAYGYVFYDNLSCLIDVRDQRSIYVITLEPQP